MYHLNWQFFTFALYFSGVHIYKTAQAFIITTYEEPIIAEQCAIVTEKLGEYLKAANY